MVRRPESRFLKSASERNVRWRCEVLNYLLLSRLATATVEATTAVESATTVAGPAAMEAAAAAEASAREASTKRRAGTASKTAIISAVAGASVIAAALVRAAIVAAPVIGPRPTIVATAVVAVEPRSGADKDAVHKPIRAVVAIGSASIRVVIVVAVSAGGGRTVVHRTSDADRDTHLGLGAAAKNEKQQAKQSCVLEISHLDYLLRPAPITRVWPVGFPAGSPGEAAYDHKTRVGEESCF
jgi:hypothetical protein